MALCYLKGKKNCFREIAELSHFLTVKLKIKTMLTPMEFCFILKGGETG